MDLSVRLLCFCCGRAWKWAILLFPSKVPGQSKEDRTVYRPWLGSSWIREGCTPERWKEKWMGVSSAAFCFSFPSPTRMDRLQNMVLGDTERHGPPWYSVNPDLDTYQDQSLLAWQRVSPTTGPHWTTSAVQRLWWDTGCSDRLLFPMSKRSAEIQTCHLLNFGVLLTCQRSEKWVSPCCI